MAMICAQLTEVTKKRYGLKAHVHKISSFLYDFYKELRAMPSWQFWRLKWALDVAVNQERKITFS